MWWDSPGKPSGPRAFRFGRLGGRTFSNFIVESPRFSVGVGAVTWRCSQKPYSVEVRGQFFSFSYVRPQGQKGWRQLTSTFLSWTATWGASQVRSETGPHDWKGRRGGGRGRPLPTGRRQGLRQCETSRSPHLPSRDLKVYTEDFTVLSPKRLLISTAPYLWAVSLGSWSLREGKQNTHSKTRERRRGL